jgi:hypothetical protein
MKPIDKINQWLSLYGAGLTDPPTRGLIAELIFRELIPERIKTRLSKGTFQISSHQSQKSPEKLSRKAKFQYDWLLLRNPVNEKTTFTLSGIPFDVFKEQDVCAFIEIKTGPDIGINKLEDVSFSSFYQKKAMGKPWVYISFTTAKKLYQAFLENSLDLSQIHAANGRVFFFHAFGQENQAENTLNKLKEVSSYLESLIR